MLAKKVGRPPPEGRPISCVAQAALPPVSARCAPHADRTVRISTAGATRKSPIGQAIHEKPHLHPLSGRSSPALCTQLKDTLAAWDAQSSAFAALAKQRLGNSSIPVAFPKRH